MPSRGRSRQPRLTRMHAAIDAMMQYGFSENLVRTQVKELLKAYGGDDGWIFIEDNAYKELLEAILRHMGPIKPEENAENGKSLEKDSLQNRNGEEHLPADSVGPSSAVVVADKEKDSSQPRESHPPAEEDGKGWKDIKLDQVSGRKKIMANNVVTNTTPENHLADNLPTKNGNGLSPAASPSQPPPNSNQSRSRWPCKFEFKVLKPPTPRPAPAGPRKRKSRWDLRPEDP